MTIGSKLRHLEKIIAFPLEESPAAPILLQHSSFTNSTSIITHIGLVKRQTKSEDELCRLCRSRMTFFQFLSLPYQFISNHLKLGIYKCRYSYKTIYSVLWIK